MKKWSNKSILITSISLNTFLIFLVALTEMKSHYWGLFLERRGVVELGDAIHPDYWVRHSWQSSVKQMHTNFDVVFFGNSITRGGDFQSQFTDLRVLNLGISGDNLVGMRQRVSILKAANPKRIFLMAGTNDLQHLSLVKFGERYMALVDEIQRQCPEASLFIQSILPMNQKLNNDVPKEEKICEANNLIKDISSRVGVAYIDLYSLYVRDGVLPEEMTKDGIHLREQYYTIWFDKIKQYIE